MLHVSVGIMKRFALLLTLFLADTAAAGAYLDNSKTATHDCSKDPEAAVAGNKNTITFTGACKRIMAAGNNNTLKIASVEQLYVPGNNNAITVDAVDAIDTGGNHNTVTWTKGITAKRPKVSNLGNYNKVGGAK